MTDKTKTKRRWLQFSLRTMMVVVTVLSVPFGWIGWELREVRREQAAIAWVDEMGGEVFFDYRNDKSWWEESTDKWFGERVRSVVGLYETQVIDLSPLAELKNLESIKILTAPVTDLSPLSELKNLEDLWVGNTQVSDLSPLAELKNLKDLNLGNTQVSDLSPLAELKSLKTLWLQNTQVSDLSPLAELKSLIRLDLNNTPVSDEQVQELRQALPKCKIEHSTRVEK